MTVVPCISHGATSHFIATNVFVIDDGAQYRLYQTEKMNKKFFELCASSQGDTFARFQNQFENIKAITIYIPNNPNKTQTIVFQFYGKKTRVVKTNFFDFPTDTKLTKIFNDKYLAMLNDKFGPHYSDLSSYDTQNTKLVSTER
jgi:hypothetical protein